MGGVNRSICWLEYLHPFKIMKWFLNLNCFHFRCGHLILADLYSYWEQLRKAGVLTLKKRTNKMSILRSWSNWDGKYLRGQRAEVGRMLCLPPSVWFKDKYKRVLKPFRASAIPRCLWSCCWILPWLRVGSRKVSSLSRVICLHWGSLGASDVLSNHCPPHTGPHWSSLRNPLFYLLKAWPLHPGKHTIRRASEKEVKWAPNSLLFPH